MKMHLLSACVVSVLALLPSGKAQAGMITIYDSTLGAWTVSWTDSRVDVTDITPGQDPNKPIQTEMLQKVANFSAGGGLAPIVLTFTENNVSNADVGGKGTPGGGAGLNFRLFNIIFNNTMTDWTGFGESLRDKDKKLINGVLMDTKELPPKGSNAHPAFAHFHDRAGSNDFHITKSPPWSLADDINTEQDLFLTQPPNKLNGDGGELNFDVRIHDDLGKDFQRGFTLTEAPVPEPASLTLFSLGIFGLIGCTWRRRTQAGSARAVA